MADHLRGMGHVDVSGSHSTTQGCLWMTWTSTHLGTVRRLDWIVDGTVLVAVECTAPADRFGEALPICHAVFDSVAREAPSHGDVDDRQK